jgi:thioredoxin reductase (NADPH)
VTAVAAEVPSLTLSADVDILVVGAGPSGLYAAYYAGFRGWSVAIMDSLEEPGGQVAAMYPEKEIFDIAGFPSVVGSELIGSLLAQAATSSPQWFLNQRATELITNGDDPVIVRSDKGAAVRAKAVIITGGIGSFAPRPLPAAAQWQGTGLVHFVKSAQEFANKNIVVVGGGDSAFDWAAMLAPIAASVTMVHRRDGFRGHAASVERVKGLGVPIIAPAEVAALRDEQGDVTGKLASMVLTFPDGSTQELPADACIAALGFIADPGPISTWGLELANRKVVVHRTMESSIPRVYAAGDMATYDGKVALISVGFGEAATAVNNAFIYIQPESHAFPGHSSG